MTGSLQKARNYLSNGQNGFVNGLMAGFMEGVVEVMVAEWLEMVAEWLEIVIVGTLLVL